MSSTKNDVEYVRQRLATIAAALPPRDYHGFADACAEISPALGEAVRLHAEAADGNSPDLSEWVEPTAREWAVVAHMTTEEARSWWLRQYGS